MAATLQNTFQLENDFTVKYTDVDGDLCTISGKDEFEDLVKSDQVKERKGTLRLKVVPKGDRTSLRPSIFHRRNSSSDQSGASSSTLVSDIKAGRSLFDSEYSDSDMLEVLRDISLFICARGGMDRQGEHDASADLPPGASSWVSTGKNLITPTTARNYQRLNARSVRGKIPVANISELLNGLDSNVSAWSVETTGQFLVNNGYEDFVQQFKEHDITGDVLLDLTHDTLKDMGMTSTGRRIRLLKMCAELQLHVADITMQEATDSTHGLDGLTIN
ncbi:SH3 and multiple ankyrin repeat domains protein 2 [Mortierella sp. GBA43]|nr:SH3 and multiple ankyrin repeat domains protein 2 [Mortierella sp. GBA43]